MRVRGVTFTLKTGHLCPNNQVVLALRDKLADELPGETEQTVAEAIAGALITEALSGNVQAIREIADRTEGKPTQPHIAVDVSHEGLNAEIEDLLNKWPMANQRPTENREATNECEVLPPTLKLLS